MVQISLAVAAAALLVAPLAIQAKKQYNPFEMPKTTEQGQTGTNQCGGGSSSKSKCQNLFVNSASDFCLFGPPSVSEVGEAEERMVSYCLKDGYGTRLIPDGTLKGVHFLKTAEYVQVTGVGDFTKINIKANDAGGELDPHGATGLGNPIGSQVFSTAFGTKAYGGYKQIYEWTNFMAADEFCIRACVGPRAKSLCNHIYDLMGCAWNMPASYSPHVFESCEADSSKVIPMGIHDGTRWYQGQDPTPGPNPKPKSSQCKKYSTIKGGEGTRLPNGENASVTKMHSTTKKTSKMSTKTKTTTSSSLATTSASATSTV